MASDRPPFVRPATPADRPRWEPLWSAYLAFYRQTLEPGVTDITWARAIDPAFPIGLRLAEGGGRLLGFALHVIHPQSWAPQPTCYLEDLFVAEEARGQGVGRLLIDDLLAVARAGGWSPVYWVTEAENATARRLYDRYAPADGYVRYKLMP